MRDIGGFAFKRRYAGVSKSFFYTGVSMHLLNPF